MASQATGMEAMVKAEWRRWGGGYALYTECDECHTMQHCRGKRRSYVLCLCCFDQVQPT